MIFSFNIKNNYKNSDMYLSITMTKNQQNYHFSHCISYKKELKENLNFFFDNLKNFTIL